MGQIADFSRSDSAHFGSLCFQLRLFFKDHMQKTIEIDPYIEGKKIFFNIYEEQAIVDCHCNCERMFLFIPFPQPSSPPPNPLLTSVW